MNENLDFEQDYYSRTAKGIYKLRDDTSRILEWWVWYDRSFYENINYYDLMGSVLKSLKEVSEHWILCRSKG